MLYFLSRSRAARWVGFEGYNDTGRKLNGWFIGKSQWTVIIEALPLLNSDYFIYS